MAICPFSLCPLKTALDYMATCPRGDCPLKAKAHVQTNPQKPIEVIDPRKQPTVLKGVKL